MVTGTSLLIIDKVTRVCVWARVNERIKLNVIDKSSDRVARTVLAFVIRVMVSSARSLQ